MNCIESLCYDVFYLIYHIHIEVDFSAPFGRSKRKGNIKLFTSNFIANPFFHVDLAETSCFIVFQMISSSDVEVDFSAPFGRSKGKGNIKLFTSNFIATPFFHVDLVETSCSIVFRRYPVVM